MNQSPEHIDKREVILAVAEKLFSEQDFDAVSVRDLARGANVNVAMISYYFGSKEKLLTELINRKMEISQNALSLIVSDGMGPWEKMIAIINMYVDKLIDNREYQKLITRELSTNTRPYLRDSMIGKMQVNREVIRGVIQDGIDQKIFHENIDMEMVMMSLFATLNHLIGVSHYSCEMFNKKSVEELFTVEFKERIKTFFKNLLSNYILIKQ